MLVTPVNTPLSRMAASLAAALVLAAPVSAAAQAAAAPAAPKPAVVYLVEQLASPELKPELMEMVKPLHTLQEVETLLKSNSIPFSWRKAELDGAAADPRFVEQIEALPAGEVFVINQGNVVLYSVIIGRRPKPAT